MTNHQLALTILDHYHEYIQKTICTLNIERDEATEFFHTMYANYIDPEWGDDLKFHALGGHRRLFSDYYHKHCEREKINGSHPECL